MFKIILVTLFISITFPSIADVNVSHAIAMHGEPKYSKDFEHVDYADPNGDGDYDRRIGGYSCSSGEPIAKTLGEFECEEEWVETDLLFENPEYPIFGAPYGTDSNLAKIEISDAPKPRDTNGATIALPSKLPELSKIK
mgnify:CR=1 FL=1